MTEKKIKTKTIRISPDTIQLMTRMFPCVKPSDFIETFVLALRDNETLRTEFEIAIIRCIRRPNEDYIKEHEELEEDTWDKFKDHNEPEEEIVQPAPEPATIEKKELSPFAWMND